MCGRYTNTASPSTLAQHFGLLDVPEIGTRRYNVAPTDQVLIAVAAEEALQARVVRWGLIPHWAKDAKGAARMINARSETVTERPAFRELIRRPRQRCLVLADGYYEWLKAEDTRQPRVPIFYGLAERRPFAFAGLRTSWRSPEGEWIPTATILTTRANPVAATVHDRMPVMLTDPELQQRWLSHEPDPETLAELTAPLADGLLVVARANPVVNSVKNDGPECLVAPGTL